MAGAGWFPDPDGDPARLRYFDGQQWTDHRASVAPAPVAPAGPPGRGVGPPAPPDARPGQTSPARRRWIAPLAGATVLVVVAMISAVLVVARSDGRPPVERSATGAGVSLAPGETLPGDVPFTGVPRQPTPTTPPPPGAAPFRPSGPTSTTTAPTSSFLPTVASITSPPVAESLRHHFGWPLDTRWPAGAVLVAAKSEADLGLDIDDPDRRLQTWEADVTTSASVEEISAQLRQQFTGSGWSLTGDSTSPVGATQQQSQLRFAAPAGSGFDEARTVIFSDTRTPDQRTLRITVTRPVAEARPEGPGGELVGRFATLGASFGPLSRGALALYRDAVKLELEWIDGTDQLTHHQGVVNSGNPGGGLTVSGKGGAGESASVGVTYEGARGTLTSSAQTGPHPATVTSLTLQYPG